LDDDFKNTPNLQILVLPENHLNKISNNAFRGLTNLQSLRFWDNDLTEIPSVPMSSLSSLQALGIGKNPIAQMPADAFPGLKNLQYLDFTYLNLSIAPNALRRLPNLLEVDCDEGYDLSNAGLPSTTKISETYPIW
jgi:Leucine-rich repeat (LRR) protein